MNAGKSKLYKENRKMAFFYFLTMDGNVKK
jgi:hypothetical protein